MSASEHWYRPRARDYACNQHPKPSRQLTRLLAEHTSMTETMARHILDRLRHLSHCVDEPDALTLYRLQPGDRQTTKVRATLDG